MRLAAAIVTPRGKAALSEVWSHKPAMRLDGALSFDTMTKSTYGRKDLTEGLFMALEAESMVMVGSMVAGRQAWCWGKGLHPQAANKKGKTGGAMSI